MKKRIMSGLCVLIVLAVMLAVFPATVSADDYAGGPSSGGSYGTGGASVTATRTATSVMDDAATPLGKLGGIAPSFVAALEEKLKSSWAAETYVAFRELCDPAQIWVGFKKNTASGGKDTDGDPATGPLGMTGGIAGGNPLEAPGGAAGGEAGEAPEAVKKDPYMFWMIAPSLDGNACAVEFAGDPGEAAATFVYRFDCGFDIFAGRLNRALEAIDFKREVIRLTDGELKAPDKQDARMAVQRNAALQLVRACLTGRVIHSGMDSWKHRLTELWEALPQAVQATEAPAVSAFCPQCGAKQPPGIKFCGGCGVKL